MDISFDLEGVIATIQGCFRRVRPTTETRILSLTPADALPHKGYSDFFTTLLRTHPPLLTAVWDPENFGGLDLAPRKGFREAPLPIRQNRTCWKRVSSFMP